MSEQIYRSTVPGDETTQPIPTELTSEERDLHEKVSKLQLQIAQGAQAQLELRSIRRSCKHHAFIDIAGLPYDTRYCAACGSSMGVV